MSNSASTHTSPTGNGHSPKFDHDRINYPSSRHDSSKKFTKDDTSLPKITKLPSLSSPSPSHSSSSISSSDLVGTPKTPSSNNTHSSGSTSPVAKSPTALNASVSFPASIEHMVPYTVYANAKNEKDAVTQKLKQQKDDFLKLSVDLATEQSKVERLKKKNFELKSKLLLLEPHIRELGGQVEQKESLMAYLNEKHQDEVREIKRKNEYLESERAKLESQLDEIHCELTNTNLINRVLEEKFGQVKDNKDVQIDVSDMSESHRQLQMQLKLVIDEVGRLKRRMESPTTGTVTRRVRDIDEAPIGKITLVFTDVENSTALWDRIPKTMTESLKLHNNLVRGYIERFHGYEVKTEGDAFMVAFQEAKDAVLFSVTVQEGLMEIDWPDELLKSGLASEERDPDGDLLYRGLRLRMGVHMGVPMCQPDPITDRMDYFGQMVNKSARIGSVANPGQILVSKQVAMDLENSKHILAHISLIPLGSIKLKGIHSEVDIYQILPASVSKRTFPPLSPANEAKESKFTTEMLDQMDKLSSESEQLKKQITLLENRLNQLDAEAAQFAQKLTAMKEKQYAEVSVDSFNAMWDELNGIIRKQEETQQLVVKVDERNTDMVNRLQLLSDHWNSVFSIETHVENPQLKIIKQKVEALKSNVAKKEQEKNKISAMLKTSQQELEELQLQKNRFVKLFKETQSRLTNQEKAHREVLQRKQALIDSLKNDKLDLLNQIQQLKSDLEVARNTKPVTSSLQHDTSLEMVKGLGFTKTRS